MNVIHTEAGPTLQGEPEPRQTFSRELLEQVDGETLVVDGNRVTFNLVNARVVYQLVESTECHRACCLAFARMDVEGELVEYTTPPNLRVTGEDLLKVSENFIKAKGGIVRRAKEG